MENIAISESRVRYVRPEDKCSSNVVDWHYLRTNGKLEYRRQAPGQEAAIKELCCIAAIWPWDGSLTSAFQILIEATALNAGKKQVRERAKIWGCDNESAKRFAAMHDIQLGYDGESFMAARKDFENIQESPVGFGTSYLEAMANLCIELGYVGSTEISLHFLDLVKM